MKGLIDNSRRVRLALLLALCVPAFALASKPQSSMEKVTVNVSFADLNLDNEAGVEHLYRRIRSAASDACGPFTLRETGSFKRLRENQLCYTDVLDKAVRKVDNVALSKRHFG
jgi:UrcA family protein